MIRKKSSTAKTVILVTVLLAVAYMLRNHPFQIENLMVDTLFVLLRAAIHVSLLVAWIVSLHRRLVSVPIRRLILGSAFLMVFWLVVKTVKYEFLVSNFDFLGRYMWYCFYIPMIIIPLLGAFVVAYIGQPEDYRPPRWMYYLFIPAFILLALVFTNDIHQWVFRFYNGLENYDKEYTHGIPYFITMAWFILWTLHFVAVLLKKCRVPGSKKAQALPLWIALASAIFWIVYALLRPRVDLTVIDCLIIAALLESALQTGMIPSNANYQPIFDAATIPIHIVDEEYQVHYVSAGATPVSETQMRQSADSAVNLGDTLLNSAPISGGWVVWQDDIRQINALYQQLQDTLEQLNEESILIQAEAEVKKNRAKIDEQNRLYDRIAAEVEPQLIQVERLLQQIEAEPENTKKLLVQVCVIGSYIKRRGNLLLLAEEDSQINTRELEYAIRESLDNLQLGDVSAALVSDCTGKMPSHSIVSAYDFYEKTLEQLLPVITAMMVNLTCRDGSIHINIQLGCRAGISEQLLSAITPAEGTVTWDIMDEDAVIDLHIHTGGEEK